MNPAHVALALMIHFGLTVGLLGLLAVVQSASPALAARGAVEADERPGRSLLAALGTVLLWLALAGAAKHAGRPPVALAVAGLGAAILVYGALAAAAALGARLLAQLGRAATPLGGLALGWLVLAALALVPVVGWLVLASALLVGIGAAVRALFLKEERS